jgi:hypothetical protein
MGSGIRGMIIQLTQGKQTLVDDEDYPFLSQWKWQYGANGYAVRDEYLGKVSNRYINRTILMHRVLLNAPLDMDVDHKNRDKLDNRRANLRLATRSQNRANVKHVRKTNSELPMGVTYNPSVRSKQPFMARVCCNGKSFFLGNFYSVDEASAAYQKKKAELFGEFA